MKKLMNLIIICISFLLISCGKSDIIDISIDDTADAKKSISFEAETEEEQIVCYVCGEVVNPGIYHLNQSSRIYDLIEAAGGFLDNADSENINLAQKLNDGQQVVVKSVVENEGSSGSGKVNINQAGIEDLMTLPGIGESKAAAIIDYRESIGWFSDISQIQEISGIGEKMYVRIADLIEV